MHLACHSVGCCCADVGLLGVLQVQRNWMYLENIFIGSEDIRKQLPQESLMFEGVHHTFTHYMQKLHTAGNVVQATTAQGLLAAFQVGVTCCVVRTAALSRVVAMDCVCCSGD